ncbi:oleosin L-like [Oryza brachyantha]|uniref:oleosin L-like n=1 Tax=Oryza brachyantha TaxID=4533 RepID=UPI001ADC4517|nr:oleosin L-like [Oryza brachyantha]
MAPMVAPPPARAHLHHHGQHQRHQPLRRMEGVGVGSALRGSPRASSLAVAALLVPVGAALLAGAGAVLLATLVGLALAAPPLVLFSPVLAPAAAGAGMAVAGLLAAGGLGVAGVSALAWAAGYLWRGGTRPGWSCSRWMTGRCNTAAAREGRRSSGIGSGRPAKMTPKTQPGHNMQFNI